MFLGFGCLVECDISVVGLCPQYQSQPPNLPRPVVIPSGQPKRPIVPEINHPKRPDIEYETYLQILIRSLLVLLSHRIGRRSGEGSDSREDDERNTNTDSSVRSDFPALSRGRQGAGPVGPEGDVVCYSKQNHISYHSLKTSTLGVFQEIEADAASSTFLCFPNPKTLGM